jgi:chemotaxis protein CheX
MTNVLYNPFLNATRDVFQLMLDLNNISDKPHCVEGVCYPSGNVDIAINIIGDLEGKVVYHFPKETSLEMVKIMSGGMEFNEIDDFVTSAMGEIANIISGNVTSILSTQEIACDIQPPEFITPAANEDASKHYDFISGMQICTEIGNVQLDIMLNKNSAK